MSLCCLNARTGGVGCGIAMQQKTASIPSVFPSVIRFFQSVSHGKKRARHFQPPSTRRLYGTDCSPGLEYEYRTSASSLVCQFFRWSGLGFVMEVSNAYAFNQPLRPHLAKQLLVRDIVYEQASYKKNDCGGGYESSCVLAIFSCDWGANTQFLLQTSLGGSCSFNVAVRG